MAGMARSLGGWGQQYSPVWDVGGGHHGGDVHHRVADHAGAVGVRELPDEVARQEAPMRATKQCHPAGIQHLLLQHSLHAELPPWETTTEQAVPPSLLRAPAGAQGAPGPRARPYLHITYVLCAHVAWQGGHVVLAKAQRATVIHCVGGSVRALPPLCPHPGPSMGAVSPKAMVSLTQQHGKAHTAQRRRVQHPPGREDRVGTPYKWQRQRGSDTAWLGYSGVGTSSYHGASRPRGASGQWDPRLGASG